jgi:hypothetical protein
LKTSDIEDYMDPTQAMHMHGAMKDDGNNPLLAVANLRFGRVKAHAGAAQMDEAYDDPPPEQKNQKDTPLSHI